MPINEDRIKNLIYENNEKERKTSDDGYARKWVERGVITVLGALAFYLAQSVIGGDLIKIILEGLIKN